MSSTHFRIWANDLESDAVRLVAFQRWLASELGSRLAWPTDPGRARRQIGQVSAFIQGAVADLAKRGWLFRPDSLAGLLLEQIDRVAAYQRRGGITDLYRYLQSAWENWAGRNAEELRTQAAQERVRRGQDDIPAATPIVDLVWQNLRAKDAELKAGRALRSGARLARRDADAAAPDLPGLQLTR